MVNLLGILPVLLAADQDGGGLFGSGWGTMLTLWIPILFIFYFLLIRPQQRERKSRDQMIRELKPNDRVLTVGGIYGVVTNVHREADAVTLKVDESNNTKIRVSLGAIARVLVNEPSKETSSKKD